MKRSNVEYKLVDNGRCLEECVSKYFNRFANNDNNAYNSLNNKCYTNDCIFNEPVEKNNAIVQEDDDKTRDEQIDQNISQDSGILLHTSQEISDSSDDLSESDSQSDSFLIEPFFNITPRPMPESPHHVIEEEFKSNPWVMLVATIFLTKTSGKVARPFMKRFFEHFPTPLHVLAIDPSDLEEYFETLGLRKRGTMIWKMSYQFISGKWKRASDLCGIGKYGEDAYRLFCLGHYDIDPTDRYLKLYLDWLKTQTNYLTAWSVADCEKLIIDPVDKYYSITIR